jgi:opacity protein-like surface antigen
MQMKKLTSSRVPKAAAVLAAALGLAGGPAQAIDLIGFYVGGSAGRGTVELEPFNGRFSEDHTAWKVLAGVRPISLLGAELSYLDLGHPDGTVGGVATEASIKGESAFGMLYLPIPLPILDVFVKAGVARLDTTATASSSLGTFSFDDTDTKFAAGAGAQLKFGSLAIRAEYERFETAGANPYLMSVGLTKTFL